jgi:hypothetical protein
MYRVHINNTYDVIGVKIASPFQIIAKYARLNITINTTLHK